jgi:hypothetical protein
MVWKILLLFDVILSFLRQNKYWNVRNITFWFAETSSIEALFDLGGGVKTRDEDPVERRRRESIGDIFNYRVSEMPFPGLCERLWLNSDGQKTALQYVEIYNLFRI